MKKIIVLMIAVVLATPSCGMLKKKVKLDDIIAEKIAIEKTDNPATQYLILNSLQKRRIVLDNVLVKKIIPSNNIDYDFCVVVDANSGDKNVECHIYTKNIYKVSRLKEGQSRIDAIGDFKRFFTTLDEYYTKIDIVDAKINLRGEVNTAKEDGTNTQGAETPGAGQSNSPVSASEGVR